MMTNNSQALPTRYCDYPECMEPAPYEFGCFAYCANHSDAGMKNIVQDMAQDIMEEKPKPKRLRKRK